MQKSKNVKKSQQERSKVSVDPAKEPILEIGTEDLLKIRGFSAEMDRIKALRRTQVSGIHSGKTVIPSVQREFVPFDLVDSGEPAANVAQQEIVRRFMPKAIAEKIRDIVPEGFELSQFSLTGDIAAKVFGVGVGGRITAVFVKKAKTKTGEPKTASHQED